MCVRLCCVLVGGVLRYLLLVDFIHGYPREKDLAKLSALRRHTCSPTYKRRKTVQEATSFDYLVLAQMSRSEDRTSATQLYYVFGSNRVINSSRQL